MAALSQQTKEEYKSTLAAELPQAAQLLSQNITNILGNELPTIHDDISSKIKAEVGEMLASVRLSISTQ